MIDVARKLATAAEEKGWRLLVVGGFVRDMVAGIHSKDLDCEVYGDFTVSELVEWLTQFGPVDAYGKSFGVLKLHIDGVDIDVSVPRRDNKTGEGHKGFIPEPDPTMTVKEAASRRDFTFNSLAYDPITDEVIDHFGGVDHLARRRLAHTSSAFSEDPLRVLRGFQFCGRFDLVAERDLIDLCNSIKSEYSTLTTDRLWLEWKKWATRSIKPSSGLTFLYLTGWLEFYPELEALVGLMQEPAHHPEGSVWQHTKQAVDAAVEICDREDISGEDRLVIVLAALCHDLGKVTTTEFNLEKMRVTSYNHDVDGEEPTKSFLKRIGCPKHLIKRIVPLVTCHMRHVNFYTGGKVVAKHVRRLARDLEPATMIEWGYVVEADHSARKPLPGGMPASAIAFLEIADELAIQDSKPEPLLMGRHLIQMSLEPGPEFGEILSEVYEKQLDGTVRSLESAVFYVINRRLP